MDVSAQERQWLARHERVRDVLPAAPPALVATAATAVGESSWHGPRRQAASRTAAGGLAPVAFVPPLAFAP